MESHKIIIIFYVTETKFEECLKGKNRIHLDSVF